MPKIVIKSPNAVFVIEFEKEAAKCWVLLWPSFSYKEPEAFTSLEAAMSAVAVFVARTEF